MNRHQESRLLGATLVTLQLGHANTVEPPIMRLIGLQGILAIEIPRYRMHYGYVKTVMRLQEKSTRCWVNPLDDKLVIR
jgi:hypothetical protein